MRRLVTLLLATVLAAACTATADPADQPATPAAEAETDDTGTDDADTDDTGTDDADTDDGLDAIGEVEVVDAGTGEVFETIRLPDDWDD